MAQRLGDILVSQGAIDRSALEQSLSSQRGKLGEFLRVHNLITPRQLARALAAHHGLDYVEVLTQRPDRSLFKRFDLPHYLRYRYVPMKLEGEVMTIACTSPSQALKHELARRTGFAVVLAVTSPRDLTAVLSHYGEIPIMRRATHQLRRQHKHLSASRTLLPFQVKALLGLGVAIIAAFIWNMEKSWNILLVACNLFYLMALAFKLQLYAQGMHGARTMQKLEEKLKLEAVSMPADDLPVYSILVPLYGESFAVMSRLISALHALDYPKEKLDIKLITEADDTTTIDALLQLRPPETMEIIRVPASLPRTKPKACNVALGTVRGEFLVIYDAEDAPQPDQLRKAVALFRSERGDLACVQSPLNYYNRSENLLTKLFALEYSSLFRILLPALEHMKLPIPLGGTSNHLRVEALNQCGGWDAFNVTEDADLGIRLAYFGYRTRILPSLTLEEAPITLGAWMKQRTRWIKGYIQTWLVYMRDPKALKQRLGLRAYYGFQFFVGAPALTFLLAPILWGVFLVAPLGILPTRLSPYLLTLCMVSFVGGVVINWVYARAVLRLEKWDRMNTASAIFPFYWILHSFACARALWQLARSPHYWEKTTHGVSRLFRKA